MNILTVEGAAGHAAWDQFVHHSPVASHYHLYGWRRILEASYGNRTVYLAAAVDGQISGILPLALVQGFPSVPHLASLPYLSWTGVCAEDSKTSEALLSAAAERMLRLGAKYVELHNTYQVSISSAPPEGSATHNEAPFPEIVTNTDKVTMRLQLRNDPEAMWQAFSPKVRNQVRKAEKSGLRVESRGVEALKDFYGAFATNMRDLGSPVHSLGFFEGIFQEFSQDAQLFMIYSGSEVVGGAVLLRFKDTAEVPWASCKREYFSSCPNHLLYWEIIRSLCEQGYRVFDFGRSSRDSGTYRFKKQWGAEPEPLYWQYLPSSGAKLPDPTHTSFKEKVMVESWKRLPLGITKLLGPTIRKRFSA